MGSWMRVLANHHKKMLQEYPKDKLLIVFNIDHAILGLPRLPGDALRANDQVYNLQHSQDWSPADVGISAKQPADLPVESGISPLEAKSMPIQGVLEVIRWFQMQPRTDVGLCASQPQDRRSDVLSLLNHLGKEHRVGFSDELLYLESGTESEAEQEGTLAGMQHFTKLGYRVFAVVDGRSAILQAIHNTGSSNQILLLKFDGQFDSRRQSDHVIHGHEYNLADLIDEHALPSTIQFVWHGLNDKINLRQFLVSNIEWGECDIHYDPASGELVLSHDSLAERFPGGEENFLALTLDDLLLQLAKAGKSVKLDLKQGDVLVDRVLKKLNHYPFEERQLWFNSTVDLLGEDGFRKIAELHPGAVIQCTVSFLAPLVASAPEEVKKHIATFASWGINRFSINWQLAEARNVVNLLTKWGFEVNIYGVPDLERFLQATLMMPRSVTADFNFPEWHYYGRGSGQAGFYYEYTMHKVKHRRH